MPLTLQLDPIGAAIDCAALLVAVVQLYLMWTQRSRHNHQLHRLSDFEQAAEQVCH